MSDENVSSTEGEIPAVIIAAPSPTDELVDAWFQETTSNRGLDVAVFNWLSAQRDVLKARLLNLKGKE